LSPHLAFGEISPQENSTVLDKTEDAGSVDGALDISQSVEEMRIEKDTELDIMREEAKRKRKNRKESGSRTFDRRRQSGIQALTRPVKESHRGHAQILRIK